MVKSSSNNLTEAQNEKQTIECHQQMRVSDAPSAFRFSEEEAVSGEKAKEENVQSFG